MPSGPFSQHLVRRERWLARRPNQRIRVGSGGCPCSPEPVPFWMGPHWPSCATVFSFLSLRFANPRASTNDFFVVPSASGLNHVPDAEQRALRAHEAAIAAGHGSSNPGAPEHLWLWLERSRGVLVHVSTYQGSILEFRFSEPQPVTSWHLCFSLFFVFLFFFFCCMGKYKSINTCCQFSLHGHWASAWQPGRPGLSGPGLSDCSRGFSGVVGKICRITLYGYFQVYCWM